MRRSGRDFCGGARVLRAGLAGLGSAVLFLAASSAAVAASPGCSALNGTDGPNNVVTGSTTGTGFDAGDTITIELTVSGAFGHIMLFNSTAFTALTPVIVVPGSHSYVVPAATNDTFAINFGFDPAAVGSWSCTPAGGGKTTSDSDKVTTVQVQGTAIVSSISVAAITASVADATISALADDESDGDSSGSGPSGTLLTVMSREEYADYQGRSGAKGGGPEHGGPAKRVYDHFYKNALQQYDAMLAKGQVPVRAVIGYQWVPLSLIASRFTAESRSHVMRRTDEAFAALGYAAMPAKARPRGAVASPWRTWIDVRGTGFDQSDSNALKGSQVNVTGGIIYKLRPDFVVGAFGGYENFNYEFVSLTGRLKGDGGTVGTHAGWAITPTLRWNAMVGWTGLGYDASAATARGSFDGSRWLFSTGLTGNYQVATFTLEPSASVYAITERQSAYTDTLGTAHAGRDFTTGRVSVGGRVVGPPQAPLALGVVPYVGFYGDWRFASNDALPAAVPFAGFGDGWSGRVTGGLSMRVWGTGSLSLGAEYGGIGADYNIWTGNARLSVPF